ncbi:MAG: KamA family radical SAM protein [Firmicutes bacterium]|nr:KamA family radical SAM protein [Bacillota bacterium]
METLDTWQWQMTNRISNISSLRKYVDISDQEALEITAAETRFRWTITPYYASLMDKHDPHCPIRMQAIPSILELQNNSGMQDPLQEESQSPTPGLIHRYPDRVAFTVSSECAMYCRHCTRKRFVGQPVQRTTWQAIEAGIEYVRKTESIRDVLVTGGDPFILSDDKLERIIKALRSIDHVEIIRLGTRTPCTLPQRITDKLCDMLAKYHPIWVNTHFNHPKELTEEAAKAADRMLRAGIPVGNQSVLLKGINDDRDTMKSLLHGLLKMRIRPYYLYQCDRIVGTEHFWTPLTTGLDLIDQLQGYTTGFAVPQFIVDSPIGKIPLCRSKLVELNDDYAILRNYENHTMTIPCRVDKEPALLAI